MCNFENIKIVEGNAFSVLIPLKKRTYISNVPIDEDVDILSLTDVVVKIGGVEYASTQQEDGVLVNCPATLEKGSYDIVLTAQYVGNEIRAAYFEALTIVAYNYQSNAEQYIQGAPIELQPAFVIYNLSDAELEQLKQQYREAIAAAEAAEEAAEQAKEEFVEKAAMLDNVAQQGANPLATLSATQAAVEALAPVAQAAQAYNTGKTELATNITAKGVPASADETLPELAEKVSAIAQNSYTIDGGELYAKQLFGSLTTPNYWNLYEVLEMLLSDGRLVNYGGILLAEYYKGYDSLVLSGAGAGGAYVVSDMENGVFKMYTADTTHTWATEFDGKGNRWVAYCFANEYHDFEITDTNTSPRSIFIGRKVGTITSLVNGRCSQLVIPDGNSLVNFNNSGFVQNWGDRVVIRNIKNAGVLIHDSLNTSSIYIQAEHASGNLISFTRSAGNSVLNSVILDILTADVVQLFNLYNANAPANLASITIKNLQSGEIRLFATQGDWYGSGIPATNFKTLLLDDVEGGIFNCSFQNSPPSNFKSVFVGYKTNDKTKSVSFTYNGGGQNGYMYVENCELKADWCKPLNISKFTALTEANMYAHILQRLKQDEADCGDGVTITLGATNLAKLTSAESIALLDSLTNTYGYTFA